MQNLLIPSWDWYEFKRFHVSFSLQYCGISDYVNVLVSGDSRAQRNGGSQPLGESFYLKTAGKCCSDTIK